MLIRSISLFLLAAILFVGFFIPSSLAMAQLQQQQQQQTTTTTTTGTVVAPPPPTTPLTPQELQQQNRLQNVIAATTRDLNETEKQVSGVVFTPRWSEPLWVNANSIAVLIAYCLPGEFADSGQEILGGFGLEVLESYAVDLPQGFMAWMAVVGNEDDIQNGRRLPAAVGVICASDLNNTESRILSPQEQQQINNINQQFTTIQNTQITNIENVINIINNITTTTPPQNGTGGGGGMTPPPPTTQQPLTVEIIPNATEGIAPATIKFDSKVTGGTAPYTYEWNTAGGSVLLDPEYRTAAGFEQRLPYPNTFYFILNVTDSKNQIASDSVQIVIRERLRGPDLGVLDNATVQGEGLGGETSSREEGGGITTEEPTEEEELGGVAPPTAPEEDTGGTPPETGEEPSPPPPPPSDDTGEEGGGTPPSTTTTEEQEPPL
jgi:hypothetical protein